MYVAGKWHRRDELATSKKLFVMKTLSFTITPRFYLQMTNKHK